MGQAEVDRAKATLDKYRQNHPPPRSAAENKKIEQLQASLERERATFTQERRNERQPVDPGNQTLVPPAGPPPGEYLPISGPPMQPGYPGLTPPVSGRGLLGEELTVKEKGQGKTPPGTKPSDTKPGTTKTSYNLASKFLEGSLASAFGGYGEFNLENTQALADLLSPILLDKLKAKGIQNPGDVVDSFLQQQGGLGRRLLRDMVMSVREGGGRLQIAGAAQNLIERLLGILNA